MIDTAGNYYAHIDMCACCILDTGGKHESNCPLATDQPVKFKDKVDLTIGMIMLEIKEHAEYRLTWPGNDG